MSDRIAISNYLNLIVKVYLIGYSERGESILILFLDKGRQDKVVYSIVIDSFCYKGINKTKELLQDYSVSQIDMLCWSHPDEDHTKDMDVIINQYCNENTKIITPHGLNGKEYDVIDYNRGDKEIVNKIIKLNNRKKRTHCTASVAPQLFHPMNFVDFVDYSKEEVKVEVHALSPHSPLINARIGKGKGIKKNELSIVLWVKIGSYSLLFCGDIENPEIAYLYNKPFEDPVLLKIPHHTSSSSEDLLNLIKSSSGNLCACTTIYKKYALPDISLLNSYKKIFNQVHSTGTSKSRTCNFGIIEYSFDFFNTMDISIRTEGHAYKC